MPGDEGTPNLANYSLALANRSFYYAAQQCEHKLTSIINIGTGLEVAKNGSKVARHHAYEKMF